MSKHSQSFNVGGRTIDNSRNQYGLIDRIPGRNSADQLNSAISNWAKEYSSTLKSQYGLSDDDISLIMPMLMAGSTDSEILSYINQLKASHIDESKNSTSSQLQDLRDVGYNPDLSGSVPSFNPSQTPVGSFDFSDLPSSGGSGSLSSKFTDIAGLVLKTMSFGLQTYGFVSGNVLQQIKAISDFADSDIANLVGNDTGVVENVDDAISKMIASRGLTGNKAKKYASYVASRINSTLNVTSRLRQSSDKAVALYDSKVNGFKSSDDYINQVIRYISATQQEQTIMAEYDLKIAQAKQVWLDEHPDVTAEELDLALANKHSESRKLSAEADRAVSDANKAEIDAGTASINQGIASENLKQEQSNTGRVISDNDVNKLKNDIRKIELEGIDEMLAFCKYWEKLHAEKNGWFSMGYSSRKDYDDDQHRYKKYKKAVREYYKNQNSKDNSVSLNTGFGSISTRF